MSFGQTENDLIQNAFQTNNETPITPVIERKIGELEWRM